MGRSISYTAILVLVLLAIAMLGRILLTPVCPQMRCDGGVRRLSIALVMHMFGLVCSCLTFETFSVCINARFHVLHTCRSTLALLWSWPMAATSLTWSGSGKYFCKQVFSTV